MAPLAFSKIKCTCFLIYFTVIICATSQEQFMHPKFKPSGLTAEDYLSDMFQDEYGNYDDYFHDEGSGDYVFDHDDDDTGIVSNPDHPLTDTSSKNHTEIVHNPEITKTKFSNQLDPDDGDIEFTTTTTDNTTTTSVVETVATTTAQTQLIDSTTLDTFTSSKETTSTGKITSLQSSTETTTTSTTTTIQTTTSEDSKSTSTTDTSGCTSKDCEAISVEVIPQLLSQLPGGNFTLFCKTPNNTKSLKFIWYMENEDGRSKITNKNSALLVQEAELANSGKYVCVVQDEEGCCESSATSGVVIYEKPAYWIHIAMLLGISVGLLLMVCVPFTIKLHRRHWQVGELKKRKAQDTQPLTI